MAESVGSVIPDGKKQNKAWHGIHAAQQYLEAKLHFRI